jgi:hypothetical protein
MPCQCAKPVNASSFLRRKVAGPHISVNPRIRGLDGPSKGRDITRAEIEGQLLGKLAFDREHSNGSPVNGVDVLWRFIVWERQHQACV